jgi:hypothetical protein
MSIRPILVRRGTITPTTRRMGVKYMFLIYADEAVERQPGPEAEELFKAYWAFHEEVTSSGRFVAGDPLESVATATTVRVRDGETLTTDGPFAETKEQLGGYYILDCADLDEALGWAAKIPSALTGSIEVRPIMTMG